MIRLCLFSHHVCLLSWCVQMPRNMKAKLQSELLNASEAMLMASWALESDDEENYSTEESDDDVAGDVELAGIAYAQMALQMGDSSRGHYGQIQRSSDFFSTALQKPDREFCHLFRYVLISRSSDYAHLARLSRDMFDRLVAMLAPHLIFNNPNACKPQRHVKYQLATFLIRYGQQGSSVLDTMMKLSIGQGSVYNYCHRVSRAIRSHRPHYLGWMSPERKQIVSDAIQRISGFQKCIGSGDGTQICLDELPLIDGEQFLSRKKCISVSLSLLAYVE